METLKLRTVMCGLSLLLFTCGEVSAQGSPAAGSDTWTGTMALLNLFSPHQDNCNPLTEAFIEIVAGFGFCIEKNERAGQPWKNARNTCLQEFKRLPEIAEYQVACENAVALGLNDMTGGWEWASNFPTPTADDNGFNRVNATIVGWASCYHGNTDEIADNEGRTSSHSFRCVR